MGKCGWGKVTFCPLSATMLEMPLSKALNLQLPRGLGSLDSAHLELYGCEAGWYCEGASQIKINKSSKNLEEYHMDFVYNCQLTSICLEEIFHKLLK